jgi:uncharacterized protein (DUF2147 family)
MNEIWLVSVDQRVASMRACTSSTPSAGEGDRNVDRFRRVLKEKTFDMFVYTGRLMAVVLLMIAISTQASHAADVNSPIGRWQTERGIVRVYESQGALFARIESSFTPGDESRRCTACKDDRKDQPIIGLVIMRNVKHAGGNYEGGDILDTKSGSVYRCNLTLDPSGSRLTVRGFVGVSLFGRSVVWGRVE